jgi:ATP-binding cassette subfamily C protein LapB
VLVHLGYETIPVREGLSKLRSDSFPCVGSTNDDDAWLIAERGDDGQLLLFDGRTLKWRHADSRSLSGQAYVVRKIRSRADDLVRQSGRSWLGSVVGRFTASIVIAFCLSLAISLAALAVPLFVMQVYDLGIGSRSNEIIALLASAAGMVIVTDLMLRHLRGRVIAYVGARWDSLIAISAFQQILRLPISLIEGAPIATQLARLRQFESMRDTFTTALASTIVDVPFTVVFLAAIAFWGGHLVWIPLALVGLFLLLSFLAMPAIRRCNNETGAAKQRLQRLFLEIVTKRQPIRDLGAENTFLAKHREALDEWVAANRRSHMLNGVMQVLAQSLVQFAGIGTISLGAVWVISGAMSPGALIGVMALVWRVLSPVQATYLSASRLELAAQSVQQIDRLMSIRGESPPTPGHAFHRHFRGQISLNRVLVRFPRRTEPALRGLTLNVSAGEIVAVTGPSGSGKSTLLKALVGLYVPAGGAILVDGLDLRQISPAEWRSKVAFLPDQMNLFYGTLAQNLRLARPEATESDMIQALLDVGIALDDPLLPQGLDTRLSGSRLDGFPAAMRQSLALARCFVQQAQIYLLDNPGANVDETGAARLAKKLHQFRGRSTVVFTTFRPAYMRLADRVVVLNDGQVVGEGLPEKVISQLSTAA